MRQVFVVGALLAVLTLFVGCDSREARINRHFRQFTGTDVGVKVVLIDQDWSNGVEAIGIVELSTPSGPMTFFYYLDTDQNIWHQFYKKRIHIPK